MISPPIFERRNSRFARLNHEWAARMRPAPDPGDSSAKAARPAGECAAVRVCALDRQLHAIDRAHASEASFENESGFNRKMSCEVVELEKRSRHLASVSQVLVWATRSLGWEIARETCRNLRLPFFRPE